MRRTAVWALLGAIASLSAASALGQPAASDPTLRVLDTTGDAAGVLEALDARRNPAGQEDERGRRSRRQAAPEAADARAAAPRPDRAAERRRSKLDETDDERGESALDDDDVARDPAPVPAP